MRARCLCTLAALAVAATAARSRASSASVRLCTLAVLAVAAASAWAQPPEDSGLVPVARTAVFGRWADPRTILEFREEASGELSGRVVALMEPVYLPGDRFGPVGAPRRDDNNPHEALRRRPMLGLNLLSNYSFDGKRWQGDIYDPEDGGTYSSRLWVDANGDLRMHGYLGIPLLGRTALFKPVSLCADHMVEMLEKAGLNDCRRPDGPPVQKGTATTQAATSQAKQNPQ